MWLLLNIKQRENIYCAAFIRPPVCCVGPCLSGQTASVEQGQTENIRALSPSPADSSARALDLALLECCQYLLVHTAPRAAAWKRAAKCAAQHSIKRKSAQHAARLV